ncbi:MAG: HIT domain-containing protein [Candidatus Nomurabacteria bacterium]|jgi:diadenosine tetraphosphate (Ap4A) HIT family hydrolase|nr:HIT domain-containing protein [Candidatus Nomurabacteria bacterium]
MLKNLVSKARRARKVQLKYSKFKAEHPECTFCAIGKKGNGNEIVDETKHFWIVVNLFPYEIWDSKPVAAHLLVVPKDHFYELDDMTRSERITLIEILDKYEKRGYSFYGRAPENTARSVEHQHTHLIKVHDGTS